MCGIYCVYKQSRSCQLPFCASPIFHFEIGDFSVYILVLGILIYDILLSYVHLYFSFLLVPALYCLYYTCITENV